MVEFVDIIRPARATNNGKRTVFARKDATALEGALTALGVELRYNLRAQRGEMKRDGAPWIEMTDRSTADLRREIGEKFQYSTDSRRPSPLHYGETSWKLWTDALLFLRETDPFLEWLGALPAWDGVDRVRHWLTDAFEVEDEGDPLLPWAAQFLLLGSVARAFAPGMKLDEMPVLIGPQGIGKSTALRLSLPPEMPELFADGLYLAGSAKERAEALQGRVIVEASEMAGSTRGELESLKAFLSRVDDGAVRLAYRHNPETMLRRCVIVGTTNARDPLPNDPSGNRRFVPVVLTGGDVGNLIDYLDRNRMQLWAEAVALHKEGVHPRLPDEMKTAQAEATERARRRDELLEDAAEQWLAEDRDGFTMEEAVRGLGMVRDGDPVAGLNMRNVRRLATILRSRGYAKRRERRDGTLATVWRKCSL